MERLDVRLHRLLLIARGMRQRGRLGPGRMPATDSPLRAFVAQEGNFVSGVQAVSKPVVLVIEDQALLALHLRSIVRAAGCEVAGPVARLNEALRLADEAPVSAALLDVNLAQGEDSFPAAERLQRRGIPFAFVTAHRDRLPAAFADAVVIAKPFADKDIVGVLATLLSRAGAGMHVSAAAGGS